MRTLIVGAGRAGRALARDLSADAERGLRPIGLVDDAHPETPLPLRLPLLGTLSDTAHLVTEHAAEAVVLAIPGLSPASTRELVHEATAAGAVVRYLPWYTATLCRDATASDLRPLDIRALIDSPDPYVPSPEVKEIVTGKRVLATGADSPLGSEICRQLNAFDPGDLHLLDGDEIGDRDQVDGIFRELHPEVVFHVAGLRHATILERRPSLGVKANVETTDNLVRATLRHGTERFILITADAPGAPGAASTPGAPEAPHASMLAATHRVAETILQTAARKKPAQTVFATIRIGDVLDGRDSLLTVLADQIRAGGPVTVTHPDAAHSFATVEEAVGLTLDAGRMATGGEIYVLDVGEPVRIAEVVARFTRQYKLPEVPIRYVGLPHKENPSRAPRIPTTNPRIHSTPAEPNPTDSERLHAQLEKLYKAAAKNRDPKVRQMLTKLAAPSSAQTG